MGARICLPLRVLLPLVAVGLAAAGAGAAGLAQVSAARGFLLRQVDKNLVACAAGMASHPFVAVPGAGPVPPVGCGVELLSAAGQPLVPGAPAGPDLPASGSWLAAHLGRPVTVPGTGTGGSWRVIVQAVHYQPRRILFVYGPDDVMYLIAGRTGSGPAGLLVSMTGLAGIGQVTGRVAAGYAAAAGVVLVLLAGAALLLVRAILRPLGRAPGRWLPGMAPGLAGRILAGRAAEAAARRSAAEMAGHLAEVALELRTSVNVVRGFAEYCRLRGRPPSAAPDRMTVRAAEEVTRMEALIERLGAPLPGQAARTGPRDIRRPADGRTGT